MIVVQGQFSLCHKFSAAAAMIDELNFHASPSKSRDTTGFLSRTKKQASLLLHNSTVVSA
jgi:hypothetical protein